MFHFHDYGRSGNICHIFLTGKKHVIIVFRNSIIHGIFSIDWFFVDPYKSSLIPEFPDFFPPKKKQRAVYLDVLGQDAWKKFPKIFSQMVAKNSDLPWDRIRKKSRYKQIQVCVVCITPTPWWFQRI